MTPGHDAPPAAARIPTEAELVAAARAMAPMLAHWGPRHDADRRISAEVAAALRAAGFFRICQTVENGGYGLRPSVLWKVAREVTRADPATGWVLSLAGLHPWLAALFPPLAQEEVFEGGRDAVVLSLTGNVGRGVDARRVDAGYRLTGKWTYASGIDVSDWAALLVEVAQGEGRELMLLLVPSAEFRIDHESWRTMGMRGTGSKDVYLEDAFVPLHRAAKWGDIQANRAPGRARNKGPMFDVPHTGMFVMSVAAAVAGAATRMVDLYREAIQTRIQSASQKAQTEDRFSLVELGKASGEIDMAFGALLRDVDAMYDQAARGEPFTVEQRARYRLDGAIVCDMSLKAADALARSLGGGLLPDGPIERCFRDVHAMASHFLMQVNPSAELLGRDLAGLPLPPGARI